MYEEWYFCGHFVLKYDFPPRWYYEQREEIYRSSEVGKSCLGLRYHPSNREAAPLKGCYEHTIGKLPARLRLVMQDISEVELVRTPPPPYRFRSTTSPPKECLLPCGVKKALLTGLQEASSSLIYYSIRIFWHDISICPLHNFYAHLLVVKTSCHHYTNRSEGRGSTSLAVGQEHKLNIEYSDPVEYQH